MNNKPNTKQRLQRYIVYFIIAAMLFSFIGCTDLVGFAPYILLLSTFGALLMVLVCRYIYRLYARFGKIAYAISAGILIIGAAVGYVIVIIIANTGAGELAGALEFLLLLYLSAMYLLGYISFIVEAVIRKFILRKPICSDSIVIK